MPPVDEPPAPDASVRWVLIGTWAVAAVCVVLLFGLIWDAMHLEK